MNWLVYLVIILAVLVIARLVRILELVSELSGEDESQINTKDNKLNGWLMLLFLIVGLALAIYLTFDYTRVLLPVSASDHGPKIDTLFNVNMIIIGIVFFITQIGLFYFSYKYRHNKERRGFYYPDNHKLEFIWTLIPAIVLGGIIFYGLVVWNDLTKPAPKNAMEIEIYGKQFSWSVRYPGQDQKLGAANFDFISATNELGIITTASMDSQVVHVRQQINDLEVQYAGLKRDEYESEREITKRINNLKAQVVRILQLRKDMENPELYISGIDDIVTKELRLPVNKPVLMKLRSQDIIHSAYLPHFRMQMNLVPGMTTTMSFTPTITTEKMREITKDPDFDYVLLCNKICGVAHFNMNIKVVVEEEADFNRWLEGQKTVFSQNEPSKPSEIETTPNPIAEKH